MAGCKSVVDRKTLGQGTLATHFLNLTAQGQTNYSREGETLLVTNGLGSTTYFQADADQNAWIILSGLKSAVKLLKI